MCIALNCKTMLLKCRCRNGNLTVRLETTVVWLRSTAESSFSNYSETINLANLRIMYELWVVLFECWFFMVWKKILFMFVNIVEVETFVLIKICKY